MVVALSGAGACATAGRQQPATPMIRTSRTHLRKRMDQPRYGRNTYSRRRRREANVGFEQDLVDLTERKIGTDQVSTSAIYVLLMCKISEVERQWKRH